MFSWRRSKANSQRHNEPDSHPFDSLSALPPIVTASNSCDTNGENENAENVSITISRLPTTPEGLRPRRATCFVQRDLGLSSNAWDPQKPLPSVTQLPPHLSASWSTQGVISSGSSGGFYSHAHSGSRGDAQSPHLLPGQARTAVGAIVAMNMAPEPNGDFSEGRNSQEEDHRWQPDWDAARDRTLHDDDEEEESPDQMDGHEYFALDENAQDALRVPVPDPKTNRSLIDSPISKASSFAGSPSSRANLFYHQGERVMISENNINTSFSSQARLINTANTSFASRARQMNSESAGAYDFTPLVDGPEVIFSSMEHMTNMSAMSQSALDQESHIFEPDSNFYLMNEDYVPSPEYAQLDRALRKSKSVNQRQAKEELIVSTVGRLQDNLSLIAEVQAAGGPPVGMGDWFMHNPLNTEGFLSGISEEKRAKITKIFTQILDEMENMNLEELIPSPSKIRLSDESHNDLRDSIEFCRRLVKIAVSKSEHSGCQRGGWRMHDHVRCSLGIVHPETPEVARGGDTSVFSLPSGCDETPMTSNVSLTTTITSALTTPNGRKGGKLKPFVDGLMLRRTIEIFCALLEKLARSCHAILNGSRKSENKWHLSSQDSIRITEEIKRTYLQLLAIETHDLHTLVDSFLYQAIPLAITHEEVQEVLDDRPKGAFVLPPPPSMDRDTFIQPLIIESSSSEEQPDVPPVPLQCSERHLFSPSTEDMRTLSPVDGYLSDEEGYDDLRRQVGSADYDDASEKREEPPKMERAPGTPSIHPSLVGMGLTSPTSI